MLTLNHSSYWPAVNMDDDGDIRGVDDGDISGVDEDVWTRRISMNNNKQSRQWSVGIIHTQLSTSSHYCEATSLSSSV